MVGTDYLEEQPIHLEFWYQIARAIMTGAVLLAVAALIMLPNIPATAEPLALTARPVPLHMGDAARERVGRLIWRGGLELTSPDPRFGGLSGLLVSDDGSRMTAVTDRGSWITARLVIDAAGRLAGLADAEIGPLRGPTGAHFATKHDQDAESLARLPDGSVLVGFERNHRILRYPAGDNPLANPSVRLPVPKELETLRKKGGIEALVTLADGTLLALAEGRKKKKKKKKEGPAFLLRDGAWSGLSYRRSGRFRPSGAARLPNGDLLVIERSFTVIDGVAVRLVRVAAGSVIAGARLKAETIAVLRPPLTLDNLEGVDVRRTVDGETLIYLVSDDNFRRFQRTLLLVFALEE
jgi:hypothetical protein